MTIKQIAVRRPRLIDKDLNEVKRLNPAAQSIELNITPLSTASLTLEDGSGVAIRSFVELYNAKGSAGIFRVSRPEESFGSGERMALEHGICTLDDATIRGQGRISGTPESVLKKILEHQTTKARGEKLWVAGTVEAPESMEITVEHDGTKTLEMLSRFIRELEGYRLDFDQSGFPWKVNVVKKPDKAACEGRLSRNIHTIRKTMDDSELCTKLYCSLLDGGSIESDTVEAWGVVEQEITLNDDMPKKDAAAYCRRYLENRKNPTMSVELDADEWFAMTGERLDRFEIGDICRLALPEYGVTIEERIVSISYMDAIGRPETATVSLANRPEDLSIRTAETKNDVDKLKHTSTGYGNQIRQANTTIAHLKEENEGFKKVDDKMTKWFASAQIDLDATEAGANVGILATYQETYELFSDVDTRVSAAELVLHGGPDGATAGLIARMGDAETAITANTNGIDSTIELVADTVEVVGTLESEIADLRLGISQTIVTEFITVTGRATLDELALDGQNISLGEMTVVTGVKNYQGFSVYLQDGSKATIYGFTSGGNDGMVNRSTLRYLKHNKDL